MAEVWDRENHKFIIKQDLGMNIVVTEVKDNHVVTSSLGPPEGKFAFTSHEAGDHSICLSTRLTSNEAKELPMDEHNHQVRVHLDIIIGEAKPDNSQADRAHIKDLASRVKDLNDKLRDIRKEQQFQREREAEFRDASEKANSKAVFWSIIQAIVLVATCAWQARHLKVRSDTSTSRAAADHPSVPHRHSLTTARSDRLPTLRRLPILISSMYTVNHLHPIQALSISNIAFPSLKD
jgi:hypothetical protein